jgi:uncharacterized protein (DUF885 family)
MVEEKIIPAFGALTEFLQQEYLPACRSTAGVWDLPGGEAYYRHQILTYTTVELSADSVFRLGMSEVDRIMQEMKKLKADVGFQGEMKAFFDAVRTMPELMPYQDAEEVLAQFRDIHARMQPYIENLFNVQPKAQFEVRRTESFREASASAEYNPPSLDGSRPGIFYVPVPDAQGYNVFRDESLFLHEAIPGHHYQVALQQENERLPDFRKRLYFSAYGEGWALYSESLGKELGLYEDPYQYFGMLSAEMHRAIRLVVDAGMHAKKWTREQAIEFSLAHEAEPEREIIAEVERYMSWPGQALSYKVGQLKIRELRQRAEEALGEQFDLRDFHSQVLRTGNVPLAVLENEIDTWIAGQKSE